MRDVFLTCGPPAAGFVPADAARAVGGDRLVVLAPGAGDAEPFVAAADGRPVLVVTPGAPGPLTRRGWRHWHLSWPGSACDLLRDLAPHLLDGAVAEDAATELRQERAMFAAGPVVVFRWRNAENWPVEYVSPNVAGVFGHPAEALLTGAVRYADLVDPEDLPRVGAEVQAAGGTAVAHFHHEPYRVRRPDGRTIWVDDHTMIVRDGEGAITHYMGYVVDITARVAAEESRRSLEHQMLHAQKLESLGMLAGGIAHDFNNLLVAILGNADLALQDLSPVSPARQMIVEIELAAKRAADLSRQMLAYSGRGRFVVEPIDAGELLQEMAHLLEVSIAKTVVLKYDLAPDLPAFAGDATQIRQVIMNLITNASEAIGEDSGVVSLCTGTMRCDRAYLDSTGAELQLGLDEPLPEGDYVFFEVADTGAGMDADTRSRIFDPFFTTKFTGRGLGLSAVLGIVRGHRGAMKLYSEVGRGTTFKILFPVAPESGSADGRSDGAEPAVEAWRGTGTILLADDEKTVQVVARRMLESLGLEVLIAADGREALDIYRERGRDISCVLLDLTMPRLDGEQTFRELRLLDPDVRVILTSGYSESDVTPRFVGKRLAGFIQKPFTLKALSRVLSQACDGHDVFPA